MIFFLLNVLLMVGIILFSLFVDLDEKETKSKALTSLVLSLAVEVAFIIFVFLALFGKNVQLINLTCKLMQLGFTIFSVSFMLFAVQYPKFTPRKIYIVIRYLLIAIAAIIIWNFDKATLTAEEGFKVISGQSPVLGLEWYTLYKLIYILVLPVIAVIVLVRNTMNSTIKLYRQQMITIVLGIIVSLGLYWLLGYAVSYSPLYYLLFTYCLVITVVVSFIAVRSSVMVDFNTVKSWLLKFLIDFALPSVLAGLLFAILFPFRQSMPMFFWCAFTIGAALLVIVQRTIAFKIRNVIRAR